MKKNPRGALLLTPLAVVLAALAVWSCRDDAPFRGGQERQPPEQARSMHRSAKRLLRHYARKKDKVSALTWREFQRCMQAHRQTIRELESAYPTLAKEDHDD